MPRPPRFLTVGPANHVISHATGEIDLFPADEDFRRFLDFLDEAMEQGEFDLHHYVLLNSHFHLQVSAPSNQDNYSAAMKRLLRQYSVYHRDKYGRAGNLWRTRFRNYPINTEAYLLACGVYIELNPVRAGLVVGPDEYRWSSARFYLLGESDKLVTPDPAYVSMGNTDKERAAQFRRLVKIWQENPPAKDLTKRYFRKQPASLHPIRAVAKGVRHLLSLKSV